MTDQRPFQAATATAAVSDSEIVQLPLEALVLSELNPRQEVEPEGIAALAASIETVGLMQNLAGFRDAEGRIGIVAGGRRLRALQLLADRGRGPAEVAVRLTGDRDMALLWASAENTAREALHPADEIRAYYRMLSEGQASIAQVASAFAVTEAQVRRRVRLGALPEPVLVALKSGQITLGHAQALTISQDETCILATLEKLIAAPYPGYYSEHELRRMVQPDRIAASDRRLAFVTRAAYDAAGGESTIDLFEDRAVLHSPDVLDRIFAEKLDAACEAALAEGWAWAEASPEADLDYTRLSSCARLYREEGQLTEAQVSRYDALSELAEAEALDAAGAEELAALEAILEGHYSAEQRRHAGVLLHVSWRGALVMTEGLVRAADAPAAIAAGVLAASAHLPEAATGKAAEVEAKPALSQALIADLQAMRSAAVQGALLDRPKLALDLLAYAVSTRMGPLDLHFPGSNISPSVVEGFAPDDRLAGPAATDEESDTHPFANFRAKGEKHRNAVLAIMVERAVKYG